MSMVEVDPKLFIKCRLCLEDLGTYQIVPTVRDQINYCFDINVKPFDGLSQLICKKCQSIICDFSKTKKSYIENQSKLKRTQHIYSAEENVAQAVKRESPVDKPRLNTKRRKISLSSVESECNNKSNEQIASTNSSIKIDNENWIKEYKKSFVCRLCSSHWLTWKSANRHLLKHQALRSKYEDVFNKYCVVELPKVDSQPNLTGSVDKVVYSRDKIIAKGNTDFYVTYEYKGKNTNNSSDNEDTNPKENSNVAESSDSSFRSSHAVVRRKRRRRISSRSSTDTVVLEKKSSVSDNEVKSERKSKTNECISIDDTDSDDEKIKVERDKRKVTNKTSMNAIKASAVAKLISTTSKKYLKRHEKPETPPLDQLNRKITSIGRQIINKRGFNCTRLMKYMEHLNLNIIWLSRSPLNVTSNSNYFKIIPRLKYPTEKNSNNFAGYQKKYDKKINSIEEESLVQDTKEEPFEVEISGGIEETRVIEKSGEIEETREVEKSVEFEESGNVNASDVVETSGVKEKSSAVLASGSQNHLPKRLYLQISPIQPTDNPAESFSSQSKDALLFSEHSDTRKLLNANPVANPKQLKKFTIDTKKDNVKTVFNIATLEVDTDELSSEVTSGYENNIQMPIIKFTTSLAVPETDTTSPNIEPANNNTSSTLVNSSSENTIQTAPRIKVKSVTELMSKETLSRMKETNASVGTQNQQMNGGYCVKDYGTPQNHNITQPINNARNLKSPESHSDDYVTLDTVELPNTKTSSPFKYFRMLLQVHNLTLLDTDAILNADFHTLIRFKVLYKQETKDVPVILCLSLFCAKNVFCLKIKDRNEDNINMSKISANWQWEILKIYRGEVVVKLLNNAQKISQEVYDNTNSFLCLLKSINFVSKFE